MYSPSSTSTTGSFVCVRRNAGSPSFDALCRCCTAAIGGSKSAGSAPRIIDSARMPPREQPITIRSIGVTAALSRRTADGERTRCPLSAVHCPESLDPPVQPLIGIELFVAIRHRREAHRLFLAQAEDAEHLQTVDEELLHALLQRVVEVDQDVAAEDDVEVIEGRIGDQVVLREDDVLAQRRTEDRVV